MTDGEGMEPTPTEPSSSASGPLEDAWSAELAAKLADLADILGKLGRTELRALLASPSLLETLVKSRPNRAVIPSGLVAQHQAAERDELARRRSLVEWTPEQQEKLRAYLLRRAEEPDAVEARQLDDALRGTRVDPFPDDDSDPDDLRPRT